MKLIQLFSILIILNSIFGKSIKPENSNQIESIQVISKNNKKYTYYHLDRKGDIFFDNLERVLRKDKKYIIKIMARSPISKNSNSNKTFGFNLSMQASGKIIINDDLKYKKKISKVMKPSTSGMYFTDAGYWIEEIFSPKNLKIRIKSIKGSPDVYLKVSFEEIPGYESKESITPVTHKPYKTLYIDYEKIPEKKSIKWYSLDENKVQYKIKGPKKVKVRTRALIDSSTSSYKFNLYENGYKKGTYTYDVLKPTNDVYILNDASNKIQLSRQDYFIINVPRGEHYYSFKKNTSEMYIKLEHLKYNK